jgi:hypothetical protein
MGSGQDRAYEHSGPTVQLECDDKLWPESKEGDLHDFCKDLYRNLRQKAAVYAFTPFELMTLNLSNGDD